MDTLNKKIITDLIHESLSPTQYIWYANSYPIVHWDSLNPYVYTVKGGKHWEHLFWTVLWLHVILSF